MQRIESPLCGLCGKASVLQDSHYLPAGVYRLISNDDCPHPVHVAAGKAFSSSRQYRKPYLCLDCEKRFNENGERWTLQQLWRPDYFPLQKRISTCQFLYAGKKLSAYDCSGVPDIAIGQLGYFAVSVFWRGASTTWSGAGTETEQLRLGPYEAELRAYLLGATAFPDDCVIAAIVAEENEDMLRVLSTPVGGREASGFHKFQFFVPGILFVLLVGKRIPNELRRICVVKHKCLLSGPLVPVIIESAADLVKGARLTGKLMQGL